MQTFYNLVDLWLGLNQQRSAASLVEIGLEDCLIAFGPAEPGEYRCGYKATL